MGVKFSCLNCIGGDEFKALTDGEMTEFIAIGDNDPEDREIRAVFEERVSWNRKSFRTVEETRLSSELNDKFGRCSSKVQTFYTLKPLKLRIYSSNIYGANIINHVNSISFPRQIQQ